MTATYARATATGAVTTTPTVLHGIVFTDTAANSVLTVQDGEGGDTVLVAAIAARAVSSIQLTEPLHLQHGIYATITGATSSATFIIS